MKMPLKTGKFKFYKLETAIILTGMVLMIIGNLLGSAGEGIENPPPNDPTEPSASDAGHPVGYAEYYAAQIEKLLRNIEGVKNVTAVVYVKSEGSGVLAENSNTDNSVTTEKDSQGGTREEAKDVKDREVVILKDKDGNETVVYVSQNAPEIAGIAVCVTGGASASLQEKIKTTLMALYNIPASKISITG